MWRRDLRIGPTETVDEVRYFAASHQMPVTS